jgi:hypothetical protein
VLVDTGTTLPATLSDLNSGLDLNSSRINSILADTATTIPATLSDLNSGLDVIFDKVTSILVDTGTTLENKITSILVDTGSSIDNTLSAIKAKTDNLPSGVPKNVELANFAFVMVLSSDHVTPATGKTVSGFVSKDGAAFGAAGNSVSEIANGWYKITITATEMNADIVGLRFTAPDTDDLNVTIKTDS